MFNHKSDNRNWVEEEQEYQMKVYLTMTMEIMKCLVSFWQIKFSSLISFSDKFNFKFYYFVNYFFKVVVLMMRKKASKIKAFIDPSANLFYTKKGSAKKNLKHFHKKIKILRNFIQQLKKEEKKIILNWLTQTFVRN